jgi:hypothetical protein
MRSFTLPSGLKKSPLSAIVEGEPWAIRLSLISVRPTVLLMSGYTGIIEVPFFWCVLTRHRSHYRLGA